MTLLLMAGWDETTAEPGMNCAGASTLGTGRTGIGRAANQSTTSSAVAMNAAANVSVPTGTMFIIGLGISWTGGAVSTNFFLIQENSGATTHIWIGTDAAGHIQIKNAAGVLATSTYVLDNTAWHFMEVKAVIADSGGSCEVRIDQAVVASVTGVDTRNGGTGTFDSWATTHVNGGRSMLVDDCYIVNGSGSAPYNDYLGDCKVETLFPNGNGDSSAMVGSDGDSVNNYLLVNESPASATQYVGSSAAGNRDLYTMADLATASGTVYAVQPFHFVGKSDAGTPPGLRAVLKGSSGSVKTQTAFVLGTGMANAQGAIEIADPDTTGWTIAKVNGLQVGQETF